MLLESGMISKIFKIFSNKFLIVRIVSNLFSLSIVSILILKDDKIELTTYFYVIQFVLATTASMNNIYDIINLRVAKRNNSFELSDVFLPSIVINIIGVFYLINKIEIELAIIIAFFSMVNTMINTLGVFLRNRGEIIGEVIIYNILQLLIIIQLIFFRNYNIINIVIISLLLKTIFSFFYFLYSGVKISIVKVLYFKISRNIFDILLVIILNVIPLIIFYFINRINDQKLFINYGIAQRIATIIVVFITSHQVAQTKIYFQKKQHELTRIIIHDTIRYVIFTSFLFFILLFIAFIANGLFVIRNSILKEINYMTVILAYCISIPAVIGQLNRYMRILKKSNIVFQSYIISLVVTFTSWILLNYNFVYTIIFFYISLFVNQVYQFKQKVYENDFYRRNA